MNVETVELYEAFVNRQCRSFETDVQALSCCTIKLGGEVGEIQDIIGKILDRGKATDLRKFVLELGDALFYVTRLANMCGVNLKDVMEENILKLKEKYPNGFDPKLAHAPGQGHDSPGRFSGEVLNFSQKLAEDVTRLTPPAEYRGTSESWPASAGEDLPKA